jgi:hypothetical protein
MRTLSRTCYRTRATQELIPEFYCLPEFLLNLNRFDFGVKQNRERVDHVELPPWCNGDARRFVQMHRSALECAYVSGACARV